MTFPNWQLQPVTLFASSPVIPVIVINKLSQALPLATALLAGGIRVLEITLRTSIALEAIRLLNQELPDAIIGAGTVTTPFQLEECCEVGAKFALSPGSTDNLLQVGRESDIPFIPGIASVSELMKGIESGYRYFKFFPAEIAGGPGLLKAINNLFPQVKFCPTGGINETNFLDYLTLPNVNCVGGSWIVPDELIRQENWQKITELCLVAREKALSNISV